MYDNSAEATKSLIDYLVIFNPEQRINVLYLLSALILALISYLSFRFFGDEERPEIDRGFLSYVFPKRVYFHKSAIQDYIFAAVNAFIYYVIVVQLLVGAGTVAGVAHQLLITFFGTLKTPVLVTPHAKIIFTLCSVLALDFALFWQHYLMHKIPAFWHFHKVHHSAEVLTPITLYRQHPVDLAFAAILAAFFGGSVYGLFWYLSDTPLDEYTILGLNVAVFLFYIFGYNLRHSQIWFNYPVWLSHILVSPAQHQIHHSTNAKHFDRNMGLIFAFWDKMFGTLYVPKKFEKLEYGINKKNPNPFNSVTDLYVLPFKWAWTTLKNVNDRQLVMMVVLPLAIIGLLIGVMNIVIQSHAIPSVQMEDLTWVEVRHALDNGYDTVIIPVGGTEQNATHMVLGKHNYIVHYTAEKIAQKLGHTLVAPVIAYVPEGSISPPDKNMVLPGTVSVPDAVLEGVLKAAAESYIQHGFKHVFFIGEHGLDQGPQDHVAAALSKTGKAKKIIVASVDDYYSHNGQTEWLLARGYTMAQIGAHASIRDTSEMMVVHPDGIRIFTGGKPNENGSYGDFTKASKDIGEAMIKLKIDAAVAQIKAILNGQPGKSATKTPSTVSE